MKSLTLTLALLLCLMSNGQITTTKSAEPAKAAEPPATTYDSTQNFLGSKFQLYVGQELYVKGLAESLKQLGYMGFLKDYKKSRFDNDNIYKPGSTVASKYEDLVGKYFVVLDVIKNAGAYSDNFLKLLAKESKDTLYFFYNGNTESDFPFVVTGFFLKAKQNLVGKKYVIRGLATNERNEMKTGARLTDFKSGSIWTESDITIDEGNNEVAAIFENAKHAKTLISLIDLKDDFFVLSYDSMIKSGVKPGDLFWQSIADAKTKNGMTKAMCTLSLGTPKDIVSKTENGKKIEIWTYDVETLYFNNGLLYAVK